MNLHDLSEVMTEIIHNNPELYDEVLDTYNCTLTEIEEGRNEKYECEIAMMELDILLDR